MLVDKLDDNTETKVTKDKVKGYINDAGTIGNKFAFSNSQANNELQKKPGTNICLSSMREKKRSIKTQLSR